MEFGRKRKAVTGSEIRFNGRLYRVAEVIKTGLTSVVYKTTEGTVIKRYTAAPPINRLEREVYWLDRFKGTDLAPVLLCVDRSLPAILMTDAGGPITRRNAPDDWDGQLARLVELLKANKCCHNDLRETAILVTDGKLRVSDFGSATESAKGRFNIAGFNKKPRYYLDDYIVNYIRFKLFGAPPGSEPHCFVLWKAGEHEKTSVALTSNFEIIQAIVHNPKASAKWEEHRESTLDNFYCGRGGNHGSKGCSPFLLYFVLDKKPRYEIRRNRLNGTSQTVNVNVFDLKTKLRRGRTGFLHGSDSIQECFDNLEALTVQGLPVSYWLQWRPTFLTVAEFFNHLNGVVGLDYVVLRNFDGLLLNDTSDTSDIDILVNDFYLFKQATGAIGYKHKRNNRAVSSALEYGGYKVAGHVSIGGREISVDIRFVGDGYYCDQWERHMLERRVRRGSIAIPDAENIFYSLLYHVLVHKRTVATRYRKALSELASARGLDGELAKSDQQLWTWLDEFMTDKGYNYVRPKELSIHLSTEAKRRIGVNTADDLGAADQFLKKRRPAQAIDVLIETLSDEPHNRAARRLLLAAERQLKGPGVIREFMKSMALTRVGQLVPVAIKQPIKRFMFSGG